MKGSVAAVAALASGVSAGAHRHAHDLFRKRGYEAEMESPACSVIYETITGSMQRMSWTVLLALRDTGGKRQDSGG